LSLYHKSGLTKLHTESAADSYTLRAQYAAVNISRKTMSHADDEKLSCITALKSQYTIYSQTSLYRNLRDQRDMLDISRLQLPHTVNQIFSKSLSSSRIIRILTTITAYVNVSMDYCWLILFKSLLNWSYSTWYYQPNNYISN